MTKGSPVEPRGLTPATETSRSALSGQPTLRLDGQVAIVTGAGRGLGRDYALALAARGARVVVNGRGTAGGNAEANVVAQITAAGGQAVVGIASVTDPQAIEGLVADTINRWGRIDILVNNAGFVRDKSFAKLELEDFRAVIDVHLNGAANCTKAVWGHMLEQRYGRVVMIISSSGLAGNFGQAAYSAAKMGLVGLMNTLGIEGNAKNVLVNCLSPVGITQMNAALFTPEIQAIYTPEKVAPGLLYLASPDAPDRSILLGGGGSFERAYVTFTRGHFIGDGGVEELAARFADISDRSNEIVPSSARDQSDIELYNAGFKLP